MKKEGRGYEKQKDNKKYIFRPVEKFWQAIHRRRYNFYFDLWICKSHLTKVIMAEGSGI